MLTPNSNDAAMFVPRQTKPMNGRMSLAIESKRSPAYRSKRTNASMMGYDTDVLTGVDLNDEATRFFEDMKQKKRKNRGLSVGGVDGRPFVSRVVPFTEGQVIKSRIVR